MPLLKFPHRMACPGGSRKPLPPVAPAPSGSVSCDVLVVGGGFTGLWTALMLLEKSPGLKVMLIEAGRCGSGASGRNGGKVHGDWGSLGTMAANFGADKALEIARLGTRAQDRIRAFATAPGRDVWWREAGNLRVATTPAQQLKAEASVKLAARLGVPDTARALSRAELAEKVSSPVFLSGISLPEGASAQPARLARSLMRACLEAGVTVCENTPMLSLDEGRPNRVRHPSGEILAGKVVLATNTALAGHPLVARSLALFSSYAVMTQACDDIGETLGWRGEEGIADLRMFVHYFRKAENRRLLMGSGSGPIAWGARQDSPVLTDDGASAGRAVAAIARFFPAMAGLGIAKSWGGGIDISPDRLPFFRSTAGGHVHLGAGFSGHGVNATCMAGECLSGLALGLKDDWTGSLFSTRPLPVFPPEPFRTLGGRMVRAAILGCENVEEHGGRGTPVHRGVAALPKLLGIKVGTR